MKRGKTWGANGLTINHRREWLTQHTARTLIGNHGEPRWIQFEQLPTRALDDMTPAEIADIERRTGASVVGRFEFRL